MSVQELSDLHKRYVDLSQRFRAAWVYHQFLQSLAKVNSHDSPPSPYAGRFQDLYGQLKECSQSLTPGEASRVAARFDDIGNAVGELLVALLDEDNRVTPQALRHFFQKFRNYDEKILAQLVRFYLFACDESDWSSHRRDKVDFLITRLGEEMQRTDRGPGGTTQQLHEILTSFWGLLGGEEPPDEKVDGLCRALEEIRSEVRAVDDLDAFTDNESLSSYREFKHSLGPLLFHPKVLQAVLETNFAFRDAVRRLYTREERRIAADYQRIFDLEREVPVDMQLDQELSIFRQQVERFERRLQQDEMRLDDLAELRERARSLIPRLSSQEGGELGAAAGGSPEATARAVLEAMTAGDEAAAPASGDKDLQPLIADAYRRLVAALGDTTQGAPPRSIVLTPEIYPFHLEAREVVAYRRLHEGMGAGDLEEEGFLLEAAALRVALQESAEELREALDRTDREASQEVRQRARLLVSLGDSYMRRYEHLQEQAMLADRLGEARQMALLRTRLMRDYSGFWLLYHDDLRRADLS